jgi:hypothetical protein
MGARCVQQVLPTPLTRLRWWRICLDEAQMVEKTTAKAANLAVQIQAQHRCCCPCIQLPVLVYDLSFVHLSLHSMHPCLLAGVGARVRTWIWMHVFLDFV